MQPNTGLFERILIAIAAILLVASPVVAHDIPSDVRIQAFVHPVGDQLQLLVRVPLSAMTDVDIPKRGSVFIDLPNAQGALRQAAALWIADNVHMYEGDVRLPYPRVAFVRVTLPSDRSFASFAEAMAHVAGAPLPSDMDLVWNQQYLDVLFEYPITSDRAAFSIHPRFARLGLHVVTGLVLVPATGASRPFEFHGDAGLVRLDPNWLQTALRFVVLGFTHILDGTDHLLFILCVVIPFRRLRPLIVIVTSFTVAHSITLIAAAMGVAPTALWFPPLIELCIAMSIIYMALENIIGSNVERRWMVTFAFGLIHGFGFSFALRETFQFAGSHLTTALLAFNVGVELGQLLVILLLLPVLALAFRFVPERVGIIIVSAFVAHTAWHWMIERGERLAQFPWPIFDATFFATAIRWLLAALVAACAIWLANRALRRTRWMR